MGLSLALIVRSPVDRKKEKKKLDRPRLKRGLVSLFGGCMRQNLTESLILFLFALSGKYVFEDGSWYEGGWQKVI